MTARHIVAIGGGGFSSGQDDPLLDFYALRYAPKPTPTVCFLATASGDDRQYISNFHHTFSRYNCRTSHFSLFDPPTRDIESFLLSKDVIYVGAGNTRNLLLLWREWGIDRILFKAWELGIVLTGVSAGAVCWFSQCLSDYIPGEFNPLECLNFLSGSFCPHYDSQPGRQSTYGQLIRAGQLSDGVAIDDGVALHYNGPALTEVISFRPNAHAYRVMKEDDCVVIAELTSTHLGDERPLPTRVM